MITVIAPKTVPVRRLSLGLAPFFNLMHWTMKKRRRKTKRLEEVTFSIER